MDSPKYSKFDISAVTYKVVNGQDIKAYILTPKNITAGKHPVVVKFHGGYFITGNSLFPDWYPQWALDYCLLHSAIIVTGDYRLLPESTGTDLNEDVADFWDWIRRDLQPYLSKVRPGVEADLDKILVHGESAGGSLSLVSALSQPSGFIKAVIATYPVTTVNPKRTKPPYGAPFVPESVLQEHLSSIQPGKIVTAAIPPDRFKLVLSILQQDLLSSYYRSDEKYDVWKLLEKADNMPQAFIVHGDDDLAVPVHGTLEWVAAAKKKFGEEKIQLHVEPGAGHGFDAVSATLETPWLQDGLKEITAKWLA